VGAYTVFYSWNPAGMQNWYTANLVVPLLLAVSLPFTGASARRWETSAATIALVALVALQAFSAGRFMAEPRWPHQVAMYDAGNFLRDRPGNERIGSWNAGIIGYYEGGRVINLDGLANNDIYSYAASGELPAYIDDKGIRYLMDFERMLSDEGRRRRGGYDDPAFLDRITQIRVFDDRTEGWKRMTFYSIADRGKPE
jgi:hypothetical protein